MTLKLIVGLANLSPKYIATRHNVGSWYVHLLKDRLYASFHEDPKFFGLISCINFFNTDVYLLIPTTLMNLSGKSVNAVVKFYHIKPKEILVAHDELNFPPGIARFKFGGSFNGHQGLKDIISKLGNNQDFYRLRIGIGHPGNKEKVINFVLDRPSHNEQKLIYAAIEEAVSCTEIWFKEGLARAMNRLHTFKSQ